MVCGSMGYVCVIHILICVYSGPHILRPPLQPEHYGLKLKVVLKWRDVYIENIRVVSLTASPKIEGIVKWRGVKSQGPWYLSLTDFNAPDFNAPFSMFSCAGSEGIYPVNQKKSLK